MSDIETKNAVIKSTHLGWEDHGILTAFLYLDYGGTEQGFGGYQLGTNIARHKHHDPEKQSVYCSHFIWRCLEIAEVDRWEKLVGQPIRVQADHCHVHAIGKLLVDDWFCPKEEDAA